MNDTSESAVSWGAVIAGAVGAMAISLVLLELGMGLGFAAVSPFDKGGGISATTIGVSTIIWLTVMQLLASGLGGYLAGRLRTRWDTIHTNEVFFRDTAHGFIAWALSTLLMATLMSSAIAAVATGGMKAGGAMAQSDTASYMVDELFRAPRSGETPPANRVPEVARVFAHALKSGGLTDADRQYLGRVVSSSTGLSEPEAEQRVDQTYTQMKQAADGARKALAWLDLWLVVSMLIGAFVASGSATFGGRLRDSAHLTPSR